MEECTFIVNVGEQSYRMVLPNWETDYIQAMLAKTGVPYELPMLKVMQSYLKPGDLVLDIGANIGNHAIYLAAVVGCRVEAFEANPSLCAPMLASIGLNGLTDKVSLHCTGVGKKSGFAEFTELNPTNLGAQALSSSDLGEIPLVSLDSFEFSTPVRCLKIDVEGMEVDVLSGGLGLIQRNLPLIFAEAATEDEFRSVMGILSPLGYRYWDTYNATPTHLLVHKDEAERWRGVPWDKGNNKFKVHIQLTDRQKKLNEANLKLDVANDRIAELERLFESTRQQGTGECHLVSVFPKKDKNSWGGVEYANEKKASIYEEKLFDAFKNHLKNAQPSVVLQFGITDSLANLFKSITSVNIGSLVCVVSEINQKRRLEFVGADNRLSVHYTVLHAPVSDWIYGSASRYRTEPMRWFEEDTFELFSRIDWVVIDGSSWCGRPCSLYPTLPSVIDRMSPGAELWVLGVGDSQVQEVVDQWCSDFSLSVDLVAGELAYRIQVY